MVDNKKTHTITLPKEFTDRLEGLRAKRGGVSETEILRQAVNMLDIITGPPGTRFILRNKKTGEETEYEISQEGMPVKCEKAPEKS